MTVSPFIRRAPRAVIARGTVAAAAAMLMAGLISPALAGSTTTKPYTDAATPASIGAGATVAGTFTITNKANPQTLGSANITPPAGLSVNGVITDTGTVSMSGGTIQLRNMNLAPGLTVTVSFALTAACGSSSGQWTSQVKQSNAFNGPPGNDFTNQDLDPKTTVVGSCTLAFVNEPANATTDTVITSVAFDSNGPAVSVAALAGDGITPIDGVAITLSATPSVTVVGGTATTGPSGAAAAFSSLKITTSGTYTLTATAAGFTSDTSSTFTVYDTGAFASCPPGSTSATCTVSDTGSGSNSDTSGTASSSGGASGGTLAMLISTNQTTGACAGYTPTSEAVIDLHNTTGQSTIATITLKKALSGRVGVSSFQVCLQPSPTFTFTDRSGNLVDSTGWGLLPDCASPNNIPATAFCVISRNRSPQSNSDVLITFAIPAGDPPRYFS